MTVAQLCAALGMTQTELQSYAGSESLTGEITCTVTGEESTGVLMEDWITPYGCFNRQCEGIKHDNKY